MKYILNLDQADKNDVELVGTKTASLGELAKLNIPIIKGYAITSNAYLENLKSSPAYNQLHHILRDLNVTDPIQIQRKALRCQEQIQQMELTPLLQKEIQAAYANLSSVLVDSPQIESEPKYASTLNQLKQCILELWSDFFSANAVSQRLSSGIDHFKTGPTILVRKSIEAESSGLMYTSPANEDYLNKPFIIIEAAFGTEQQNANQDYYLVSKKNFTIENKNLSTQSKMVVYTPRGKRVVAVSQGYRGKQKLADEKIIELAKIGQLIEKHFYFPQTAEWVLSNNRLYVKSTQPITPFNSQFTKRDKYNPKKSLARSPLLLTGTPGSPLISTGKVFFAGTKKDVFKIKKGDVIITSMAHLDKISIKKAAAIIVESSTPAANIIANVKELGIPCIIEVNNASKKLSNGMIVTVDGAKGHIYKGSLKLTSKKLKAETTLLGTFIEDLIFQKEMKTFSSPWLK